MDPGEALNSGTVESEGELCCEHQARSGAGSVILAPTCGIPACAKMHTTVVNTSCVSEPPRLRLVVCATHENMTCGKNFEISAGMVAATRS